MTSSASAFSRRAATVQSIQITGVRFSPRPLPQIMPENALNERGPGMLAPASLSIPDSTSVESVIEVFSFILLIYYP